MKLSILILTIPDRAKKLERLMEVLRPQLPVDGSVEIICKEELPVDQGGPTIGANRNAAIADAIGNYVCFVDDDDMVPADYVERILGAIDIPNSLAAEAAVVGSMLIDPGCIIEVAETLDSFYFEHLETRHIFEVILAVYDKYKGVDAVMLRDELTSRGWLEEIGGVEYIAKILDAVPSSANAAYYANIVKGVKPDVVGFKGHYIVGKSPPQVFIHSMQYKEWTTQDCVHYRCPNHLNPVKRDLALQVPYPEKNHGEDQDYSMALLPLLKTEVMINDCIMYFYLKD